MRKGLIAALLALLLLWPTATLGDSTDLDSLKQQRSTVTGQLDVVRGEEAAVLTELFNLNRSLDQTRQQITQTQSDMAGVENSLAETGRQDEALRAKYQSRLTLFGQRVRFLVERGTATYLEVIFNSADLPDFIWRLRIVQAFIQRDAQLLSDVRSLRRQVAAKEAELQAQRQQLAALNGRLLDEQAKLEETIQLKNDRLTALKDQRGAYEQSLEVLEKLWIERALPVAKSFGQAFHTMTLHISELKPSQFNVSFLPVPSARVVVHTGDLNSFLQQFPDLKGLSFSLLPGKADLSGDFGGATLQIDGTFTIVGKTILRYDPDQISFAGLPLDAQYTKELVAGGGLDLDLASIIANWKLNSAVIDTDSITVKASYSP